jgi:hypothetical protein
MSKRFRIAFSFASEKRDFVQKVARILAKRFGESRILYDKYHQAEFARSDLAFHLPILYREQADLIVVVLSRDYSKKEWCGLEWNALYGLIKERKADEVLLSRFDLVEGAGLFGLAGFIDLDQKTPPETATLILERLALNEGQDKDHYTATSQTTAASAVDWPDIAPPLDWPVADHRDAQRAFAQLITRAAAFRLLLIHGGSETGKSHLTKQFLGNALKLPQLTCGRFDFKGSSDMDGELRAFAERLEVSIPKPGAGVSSQLAQIFAMLKEAARPTLLIFDTFEMVGDAERWVKETLLLSMIRAPWLRIVVVGQRVMKPHGEPWAGFSSQPVELCAPTPQEWFDYGQPHKPGLTLEFVRQAHAMSGGKSALLAQLLGPAA